MQVFDNTESYQKNDIWKAHKAVITSVLDWNTPIEYGEYDAARPNTSGTFYRNISVPPEWQSVCEVEVSESSKWIMYHLEVCCGDFSHDFVICKACNTITYAMYFESFAGDTFRYSQECPCSSAVVVQ